MCGTGGQDLNLRQSATRAGIKKMEIPTTREQRGLKVLLVSRYPLEESTPRGGVQAVTVVLARALRDSGEVDVEVLSFEQQDTSSVETVGGIRVHRLCRSAWPQFLDVQAGPTRRRVLEKIREIDPDIVHWHETYGLPAPCRDRAQLFTVHGFDSENLLAESARWCGPRSVAWRWAEKRGFGYHRDLVSINPYVKQRIEPFTNGRIHEINNPLDERFFHMEHRESENPRVLCVGWISPRKNTLTSLRAFALARKQTGKGVLVIAGSAPEPSYLEKIKTEVADQGIQDHVEFLGHVGHDQLARELSHASIFLLPSLQENAPMAIAEAMAVGVPVIASNRCGMPYMVEHGVTGYLVEPNDCNDIAALLAGLLGDPKLRLEMGSRGKAAAREKFHPRSVASQTLKVYRSILATRKAEAAGHGLEAKV